MADIFISYSSEDEQLAQFVYRHLIEEGVSVFLASVSLAPGQKWAVDIMRALDASKHVIFLASKAACRSAYVQQELGYALGAKKEFTPVIWDIPAQELPGWTSAYQPLDLRDQTVESAKAQISAIASRIKAGRSVGIALALVLCVVAFGN
jgi:TIR domain